MHLLSEERNGYEEGCRKYDRVKDVHRPQPPCEPNRPFVAESLEFLGPQEAQERDGVEKTNIDGFPRWTHVA